MVRSLMASFFKACKAIVDCFGRNPTATRFWGAAPARKSWRFRTSRGRRFRQGSPASLAFRPTRHKLGRMSESLHIVCPHCQTTNRVRAGQLASAPDCGQCKQPLFTGKPVDLAEAAFDKHLQRNQIPMLVDFWAPWCGPCRQMARKQVGFGLNPNDGQVVAFHHTQQT